MNSPRSQFTLFCLSLVSAALVFLSAGSVFADASSARLAMENSTHPLMEVTTSQGDLFIELFPTEAPNNVSNFMALAAGEVEILDPSTATSFRPRYYDGMRFHRVIPRFIIQTGSPVYHTFGAPSTLLADEINADALGLQQAKVMDATGIFNPTLNIGSKADFDATILQPLYRRMNIATLSDLTSRQSEVVQNLQQLTVKRAYENLGYRYNTNTVTRGISRGVVALANQGPDSNGAEFFISLGESPWLTGKYTVIGKVVEGMAVADAIGQQAVDPQRFSRQSTVIYSITRIE